MLKSRRSLPLTLSAVAATIALVPTLTACGNIGESLKDAYSITYEITLSGSDTSALESFSFAGKEKRDSETTEVLSTAKDAPSASANNGKWSTETIINAEEIARITAVPKPDTVASCRILIDGSKEIAAEKGAPGAPVTCEAITPKFR